jgi:subtilisin family serine protease
VCLLKFQRSWRQYLGAMLALCVLTPAFGQQISDSAVRQINDVLTIKRSLNRTQRKLSSSLIMGAMAARNQTAPGLPRTLFRPLKTDRRGLTLIDLKATSLSAAERQILALGGEVVYSSQHNGAIRAKVPVLSLEALAQSSDVQSMRHAITPHTNNFLNTRRSSSHSARRFSLINSLHLAPFLGSITSQGYVVHGANQVVPGGIDGSRVKIGVLSDSALPDRVAALVATGDLPADVTVLPGQEGSSDGENEGTAMMEIVHDLAPAAKLFFATAFTSQDSFADNIRALRFVYKCDIIVDDVSWADEAAFEDGVIAQAVNDVTADGALYFSSAANSGNITSRTSGTWEGDFKDGGDAGTLRIHDFASSGPPQLYNTLTATSGFYGLHWSDPLGHSSNDYDFFVFDNTGAKLKGLSVGPQTGTQDPFEYIYEGDNCGTATATGYCPAPGDRIVVVLSNGSARALHVDTERGRLAIGTSGATFGHNAGKSTISMAATAWNSAHTGTKPFTGFQNAIETFSSDGPRKIFFNPDGSAITPGNLLFSTNGGTTLQKPDLTAADGVFTKTPGFLPFFGTSAAAPHAAAVAALVKSANPFLSNTQIRQIMLDTALDAMAPGTDRDSGFGITMAPAAVRAAMSPAP